MNNSHLVKFLAESQDLQAVQLQRLQDILLQVESSLQGQVLVEGESLVNRFIQTYPLVDFEKIRPFVEKLKNGESQQLSTERTLAFFQTSGSSSTPKHIPVTSSLLREKASAFATFWGSVYRDYPEVATGVVVSNFIDASTSERSAAGIEICSESSFWSRRGRGIHTLKRWPLPKAVKNIKQLDLRLYTIARFLLQTDLHCIMCLNPSTLLQFVRFVEVHWQELVKGLIEGTWGFEGTPLEPVSNSATIEELAPFLTVNAEAAHRLAEQCGNDSAPELRHIWPTLQLAICWRSSLVQPYYEQLAPYVSELPMRDYISQSSECVLAIPTEDESSGGVLAYQSHFFEFIEENDVDQLSPRTLFAWQLSIGSRYEVVVTTGGGLVRYRTGDCIKVNGHLGQVPLIEFLYRFGKTSSITGEKLTECQVIQAAEIATTKTKISPFEYLCYPCTGKIPFYRLLVELDKTFELSADSIQSVVKWQLAFDQALAEINSEYCEKSRSGRLGPMQARLLAYGTLRATRRTQRDLSVSDEQIKAEVLSNSVDWHHKWLPDVA